MQKKSKRGNNEKHFKTNYNIVFGNGMVFGTVFGLIFSLMLFSSNIAGLLIGTVIGFIIGCLFDSHKKKYRR